MAMTGKNVETNDFTHFFREEAAAFLHTARENGASQADHPVAGAARPEVPVLPAVEAAPAEEVRRYWRMLRTFFRSGKGGGIGAGDQGPLAFPLLLAPLRRRPHLQRPFPCWMADDESDPAFLPLHQLLGQAVAAFAPAEAEARILKDNLPRLEEKVHRRLQGVDSAFAARPVLGEALQDLAAGLAVGGPEGEAFARDLDHLKKHLPKSGVLIPFSAHAPLHLLGHYLQGRLRSRRRSLLRETEPLKTRLADLLAVEKEKSPAARSAETLHSALDFADAFLRFDELSALLPAGGAAAMPEERYHRIEKILDTLQQAENILFGKDASLVLSADLKKDSAADWRQVFSSSTIQWAEPEELCSTAAALFDELMARAAGLFAAVRMGRLELENNYRPEVHGDFFAHFDWRSFTDEELACCPPVILMTETTALLENELHEFSRLLVSNRPVRTLVFRQEEATKATPASTDQAVFRQEPAALAVAHRNVYVRQCPLTDAEALYSGFRDGLSVSSPALFCLLLPPAELADPYLWTAAAVEGREFPSFTYDSRHGPRWGSRFAINNNPQPAGDWPEYAVTAKDAKALDIRLPVAFTFADFAALHPLFAGHFHLVPPAYWTDDLIPLTDYLQPDPAGVYARIPFVWMIGEDGTLKKAAVSSTVVLACRERLDFWHYLQENAGIHSYHVEQATDRLRREMEAAAQQQLAAAEATHRRELQAAVEEAARAAMERLADMLLDLDPSAVIPTSPKTAAPQPAVRPEPSAPAPESTPAAAAPSDEVEAEDVLPPGEAWIETPLCTSCNECIDLNSRIFRYNAEKQAYVADPRGGPFADIVRAAEKCPARIIHPGAPQNPAEAGLEALVKRAAPFN